MANIYRTDSVPLRIKRDEEPSASDEQPQFDSGFADEPLSAETSNPQRKTETTYVSESPKNGNLEQLGTLLKESPKYSSFKTLESRLKTFATWPKESPIKPEELAAAGMFYLGVEDQTKCFQCGMGLCQWTPDDSPWIEHGRWSPQCAYVRLTKGKKFLEELKRAQTMASNEVCVQNREPAAKTLTEDELRAYRRKLQRYYQFFSDNKISETLLNTAIQKLVDQGEDVNEISFQKMVNSLTDVNKFVSDIKKTYLAEKKEKDLGYEESLDNVCKICYEDVLSVALLPCGHVSSCVQCASALDTCPICRGKINGYVRVYFS